MLILDEEFLNSINLAVKERIKTLERRNRNLVGLLSNTSRARAYHTLPTADRNLATQLLSNGRFKNADHQAVVNSNYSRLSIATFQNPAPDAVVYPLKVREGEECIMPEPITFAEMYRRKMSKDLELARLKKLAKEQQQQQAKDVDKAKLEAKPMEQILA